MKQLQATKGPIDIRLHKATAQKRKLYHFHKTHNINVQGGPTTQLESVQE